MTRRTRQRTAIIEALKRSRRFRTAQQLHDDVRARGAAVGLATVYRTLRSLGDEGELDVLHPPSGEAIYRLCESRRHHHHLVCRSCGAAIEIDSPDVEAWARRTASKHRFRSVTHAAELYGLCSRCS